MKKLLFLILLAGCKHKKPAYIWINNDCTAQWIQFDDGSWVRDRPDMAAGAERLTVPCTSGPDVNGSKVWVKLPYKETK